MDKQHDYIIYLTTNLLNGKKYIGHDSFNRSSYLGSGVFLKQAVKKYGKENFKKTIIEHCASKREMIDKERFWIAHYNAVESNEFYNISYKTGGMGVGEFHTAETKAKISERCKGKRLTVEQRQLLSANQKGRAAPNKGRTIDRNSDQYRSNYLERKVSPRITLDTIKLVLADYETGMAFCDLSVKYSRRIKQAQINDYMKRAQNS